MARGFPRAGELPTVPTPPPSLPSPMGTAALLYARHGWPVFPCRERAETVQLANGKERTFSAKAPFTGKGLKDATTDEQRINAWWRQHPHALIGVPTGINDTFVLDFDPRHDDSTGEVFKLDGLKAALEAQIGCALPPSLTAITQSGGVHVYYRQPDDGGEPIRNRGNLPQHVDVRGLGGYVIAPPSVMADTGARYRWWRGKLGDEIAEAPAELIAVLRAPKGGRNTASAATGSRASANAAGDQPASASSSPRPTPTIAADVSDAVRRYALRALDDECRQLAEAPQGDRNNQINARSFSLGQLVGAGALQESLVRALLQQTVATFGRDYEKCCQSIDNGLTAGIGQPRDLTSIEANARERAERYANRSSSPRRSDAPAPSPGPHGAPADDHTPFRNGRVEGSPDLAEGDRARLKAVSARWLERKLEKGEATAEAIKRLAWSVGRRVSAGLLDLDRAKEALWAKYELIADLQHADVDRAIDQGIARGFDVEGALVTQRCASYPLTDFGIGERFRDRYGADFRFTTAKGWLGWDTRRWRVLDQDEKTPPAEVIAAVFETVRAIQWEAAFIRDTGAKLILSKDQKELFPDEDNPHGLDYYVPKGKSWVLFSSLVAHWGRQAETAGKPPAIALLARRWLTVPIENFDCDPLAINVMNGTLRFARETRADGSRASTVTRSDHARDDFLTKLAPVEYDPHAPCPLYDDMLAWAQPDPAMRRYLHQVGGYASTGETGEHQLWFNYGRGRNGKSTTVDAWCHSLGDYSGTVLIETFLDQGIKKRGDQASPDLARLGGVRLLRASEPDKNAKLNAALVKFVTGGEPMPTRALHRGFFDLLPQFKLVISGNSKPSIPDTDDGIWSRMKLIAWLKNIDLEFNEDGTPKKDPHLVKKIKATEAAGVFNRLVQGLLDYLANGLVEPNAVTMATQAYRDASDPLARFTRLCVVAEEGSRVQSSKLHEVFVAWCRAAGEKEWSNKGFSAALVEKGYEKTRSDGMHWIGIKLTRSAGDFIDAEGKPRTLADEFHDAIERPPPTAQPPPPHPHWMDDDDIPL